MNPIKSNSLSETIERFLEYLGSRNYTHATMRDYRSGCKSILQYIQENGLKQFDEDACNRYYQKLLNGRDFSALTNREQNMLRSTSRLLEFTETGALSQKVKRPKDALSGLCAESITEYMSILKSQLLSESTLDSYKLYLGRFNDYFIKRGVDKIGDITAELILGYVGCLNYHGSGSGYRALSVTRAYLRFLYENAYLPKDYTQLAPSNNYRKQAKLPSMYTGEEIARMLGAVDRGNPKGKRDYAMLLLSSHLGLRASDVCELQFSEICWDNDTISITQKKTRQRLELPLLPMIGNAIIDYLKYGRPKSDSPYVFLQQVPDYSCLSYSTFHNIVTEYILRAGISTENRRHGSHALRHSLAGRLLGAYIPTPIISEVLGHTSIESTNVYLRVDVQSLRRCSLDVPHTNYYEHNRGWKNENV
jgi:site-specific recombinase XerD